MTYTPDELITAQLAHALHGYDDKATPAKHRTVLKAAATDKARLALLGSVRRKMVPRPAKPAFNETNVTAADVRCLIMTGQKTGETHRYTLFQILERLIKHGLIPDSWTVGQVVAAKRRAAAVAIPGGVWHRELCVLADAGLVTIKPAITEES